MLKIINYVTAKLLLLIAGPIIVLLSLYAGVSTEAYLIGFPSGMDMKYGEHSAYLLSFVVSTALLMLVFALALYIDRKLLSNWFKQYLKF